MNHFKCFTRQALIWFPTTIVCAAPSFVIGSDLAPVQPMLAGIITVALAYTIATSLQPVRSFLDKNRMLSFALKIGYGAKVVLAAPNLCFPLPFVFIDGIAGLTAIELYGFVSGNHMQEEGLEIDIRTTPGQTSILSC